MKRRTARRIGTIFAAALLLPVGLFADEGPGELEYAGDSPDVCLTCHGEGSPLRGADILDTVHAVRGNPQSPFAADGRHCEACHGPSGAHLGVGPDGVRPPPPHVFDAADDGGGDAACLDCHNADVGHHWAGSAHAFEQVGCSGCHRVHERSDPVLAAAQQDAVCLDCHQPQRADLMRPSTHPLRDGLMNCADCHEPHGSAGPALLTALTVNDTCETCHAEKRGPFLWEHAPVREDCTDCHRPHGSNHRDLLVTRTPMLCQQCHLAPFHPSSVSSGAGVPPAGADRQLLGRDCMNCHTRIHGSNHPSGAGLVR